MRRTTSTSAQSPYHRSLALLGVAVGLFVFVAFTHRPRARQTRARVLHDDLPTRLIAPAPTAAVLLASVAGEEDPGAAVDAPAPPPYPSEG